MLFANEHAHANDAEYNAAVCNRTRPDAQVPKGTYREHRRGLVMWIANKANRFTLKTLTIHYATNYLDRVVPLLPLPTAKFHTLAAACLLIAAKFEERPDMVPFISEFVHEERHHVLEARDIAQFEILILKTLDWHLHCSTYLHYLDMHKSLGLVSSSDMVEDLPVSEKSRVKLMKYLTFFADMLLLDAEFCNYPRTLSAAAIVATGRYTTRIEPTWPDNLAASTGFSAQDITACVNDMITAFCRDWPDAAPAHLRNADNTPKALTLICAALPEKRPDQPAEYGNENDDANIMMVDASGPCSASFEVSLACNETISTSLIDDMTWGGHDLSSCASYVGVRKSEPLVEGDSWCSSAPTEIGAEMVVT